MSYIWKFAILRAKAGGQISRLAQTVLSNSLMGEQIFLLCPDESKAQKITDLRVGGRKAAVRRSGQVGLLGPTGKRGVYPLNWSTKPVVPRLLDER